MQVREGALADVDDMVNMVEEMFAESEYDDLTVNRVKTAGAFTSLISAKETGNPRVFVRVVEDGLGLAAMAVVEAIDDLWTDEVVVIEHFVFARPRARGFPAVGKLLLQMAAWAESSGTMIRMQASSGIDEARTYKTFERLGWKPRGRIYGRETV